MKAWLVERHGGPEVLTRVSWPEPVPGPGEALIRVEAVGLNHLDLWVRNGVPGHKFPLPLIPGCDVTGVIEALGPAVAGGAASVHGSAPLAVGTAVLVNPTLSCGICPSCKKGFPPTCASFGIIGETRHGGAADKIVVPVVNLLERPAGLSAARAAALPIAYVTAWSMLTRKARLEAGEWVLIQAGGSGVSVAAIQMAKHLGASVITTVGDSAKAAKARALGADHVIEYKKEPVREALKKILKPVSRRGVDVALDHVGVDTFSDSLRALDWGGRLVTCGATTGSVVQVDLKPVFFKNLSILGSTMGSYSDLVQVVDLVTRGKIDAVIDSTFPILDLPKAMQRLESREAFGKVVCTF